MGTADRACCQRVANAQRHHLAELIPDPRSKMSMSSMATRGLKPSRYDSVRGDSVGRNGSVGSRAKACTASSFAAIALAIAIGAASLQASSSRFFQAATQAEFLKGDVDNLSIDSQGRLILGPATELVYETSAPFVWSVAAGSDGSMFVGTGN